VIESATRMTCDARKSIPVHQPPPAPMVNEPQIVLRHQMSHVQCRPLATNTPKDAEAKGDASERNIPLGDSYWSDLLS
jgi:hypothetical protein